MKASTGKKVFASLLMLTLLLSAAAFGGAAAYADGLPEISMDLSDEDQQLSMISSRLSELKQSEDEHPWYYTVTDLNHDGRLEFIAASQHPEKRDTNLRIWEVGDDRSSLTECSLVKDAEESFPDILTEAADTYYNAATDTWYYQFYDNIVLSDTEVYTIKTAVWLKDGKLSYEAYALEHSTVSGGVRSVSHTDANGATISPEQYNAAGSNAMAGLARTSTNFEWLKAAEVDSLTLLTDSFSVFMGQKKPIESFPVPKPAALQVPEASPSPTSAPTPTPVPPAPQPQTWLTITKNPTNENHTEGETAYFVSGANAYESVSWTFVSPDGGEYAAQSMLNRWEGLGGINSTTLSIANVSVDMNGWGAYCTFFYKGQTARTATAWLYVAAKPQPPAPPVGVYHGTVTDWNYASVTLDVQGVSATVSRDICDIDGDLASGAAADVYWDGQSIYYCKIYGEQPTPPVPVYGSMSGTAHEGGAGYAIDLENGDQVFVDSWICKVEGQFYDGCDAVVYYTDYPSNENIYKVDIYGNQGLIIPPDPGEHATGFDPDLRPSNDEHATGLIIPSMNG